MVCKTDSDGGSDCFLSCLALFPFYWALTTSLRKPAETFTVAGLGIPYLQFQPTLENWRAELGVPENINAVKNSVIIAFTSAILPQSWERWQATDWRGLSFIRSKTRI